MDEIAVGCVIALGVVAIVEVVRAVHGRGSRSLTVAVCALAVARTLDLEVVAAMRSVAVAVMEHGLVLVSAAAVVHFLMGLVPGSATDLRLVALAADRRTHVVVLAALLAPVVHFERALPADADARGAVYASSPLWALHWAAFLSVLAVVFSYGALISLRSARHAVGIMRWRMASVGAGHAVGAMYVVLKAVRLVATSADPTLTALTLLAAAEQVAETICILAIAAGLASGSVIAVAEDMRHRYRVWVLWPLWVGLWDHAPHLPFSSPPRRWAAVLASDIRIVLVRQVVELGDATRVLAEHMPEHEISDPADQACALAVAAARRAAGAPPLRLIGQRATEATVDQRIARLAPIARRWRRGHNRLAATSLTEVTDIHVATQ